MADINDVLQVARVFKSQSEADLMKDTYSKVFPTNMISFCDAVIELLKDSVPQRVVDQIKWERDIALSQLKEIGKGLGEKMDDVKPMKPHYTTLKYIVSGKEVSVKHPECPKCIKNSGLYLWDAEIERGQAFCKRCGQAIDWSKDGEQE